MKLKSLLFIASTATVFAGTPSVAPAPAPAPAPTLAEWFVGGTFGELNNVGTSLSTAQVYNIVGSNLVPSGGRLSQASIDKPDFNVYTLDFGRSITNYNGWDLAGYLEVGWLDGNMKFKGSGYLYPSQVAWSASDTADIDIIPVTINGKVQHQIYGPIDGYLTAGIGYAWSKVSAFGSDTTDGGFYGQASAGLLYNVCPQFQLFGGARWYYLSHVNMGDTGIDLGNDKIGWEIGARYKF